MTFKEKQTIDGWLGGFLIPFAGPISKISRAVSIRLRRRVRSQSQIVFLKLLGGGSLIIALPAILSIRKQYPLSTLSLVTTRTLYAFAHSLRIFDHIYCVDDRSLPRLLWSSFKVWKQISISDWFIDFEVHSKLAAVFTSTVLSARKIGFFVGKANWKRPVYTDLLFFTPFSKVFTFYDRAAHTMGCTPASMVECREWFKFKNQLNDRSSNTSMTVTIGHDCSDLAPERMLPVHNWVDWISALLSSRPELKKAHFIFLSGASGKHAAQIIIQNCLHRFPDLKMTNSAGQLDLIESVATLSQSHLFLGIDSALLHYARLLGVPCESAWGPTHPATLLRPTPGLRETVHYQAVPCSPCVHVTETPACHGNNLCMQRHFSYPHVKAFPSLSSKDEVALIFNDNLKI